MLKHLKKLTNFKNLAIYFVVHAVILVAVVFSVIRIMLPHVKDNLPHVEKLASESFGVEIRVDKMDTGWRGFGPTLRFEGVTMLNAESHQPIAEIHYFDVELDLFGSLRHWKLIPGRLTLDGVSLTIEQEPSGNFRLKNHSGMSERPLGETLGSVLNRFQSLEVKNGDFDLVLTEAKPLNLHLNYMSFSPHRGHYRFEVELLNPESSGKLKIISDINGDLEALDQSMIDGYVNLSQVHYDSRYMPWKFYSIKPIMGQFDLDAWFKWEAGEWKELIGKIALDQVVLQSSLHSEITLPFDFDAEIAWQKLEDDLWRLSGDKITLKFGKQGSAESSFILEGGAVTPWNFRLNTLALDDVLDFLTLSDQIDNKARDAIRHLNAQGELRDLQWIGTPSEAGFKDWHLGLRLNNLHWQAYEKIPAVTNISGEIKLSEHQGQLLIDSKNVDFNLPTAFEKPLSFSTVKGLFAWNHDSQWTIQSQHLSLINSDLQLDASLTVVIPEKSENTTMDLLITSSEFDQSIAKKYLPIKSLPTALVDWIKKSIESGRVTSMKTVIKGPVNQFPYKKGEGEFDMRFSLADVDLRYHPEWPPARRLNGELVLEGNGLQAFIDSGSVFDTAIKHSKVSLLYSKDPEPLILHISGLVEGTSQEAEKFLRASVLWKSMGSIFELVKIEGPLSLDFKTDIPLRHAANQFKIEGKAQLADGTVTIEQWKIGLEKVKGELAFTNKSVTAESIQGTFMGRPGVLSASTEMKNGISEITWNFHSILDKSLIQHFAKSDYWNYIEGKSEYDARFLVTIPKRETPFALTLLSSLEGITLDLPKPMHKTSEQKIQSSVTLTFPKNDLMGVEFHYGNHAQGFMDFLKNKSGYSLKNAQFIAGAEKPTISRPASGMQITGHAPSLTIQEWTDFFNQHEKLYPKKSNEPSPELLISQLRVDDLQYNDWHLNQANLSARRSPDHWLIDLSSQQMAGSIQLPHRWGAQPLVLDLSHCTWPLSKTSTSTGMNKLTPKDVRPIDFKCSQFNYKNADIGSIHLGIVPHLESNSVIFDPILLESPIDHFSASGTWAQKNGQLVSAFNGKATSSNMGNSLRAWGVPTDVQDAKGDAEFSFSWPGSPADMSMKALSGELNVRMQNGRFVGVNPGFGRMLGLLSLQGLQRRLRLDFSDVFKEGFAFDTFKSNILIASGNAYTTNATLKAPAADITFSGRTGLVARDLDFDMLVQAHIDSTIPAAAVAIANPAAGAAVWIVDKVFNPLGNVTRYRYHVTGTWETPVFTDLTKEYREELDGPAKVEEAR